MRFLIRSVFWLSLLLLVLPLGSRIGEDGEEAAGAFQALFAAREVVQDMAGLCERQPDVCATAVAVFKTIGARAQEGLRVASEMLEDDAEPAPEEPTVTGSIPAEENADKDF